ncbi:hypothetical protein PR001_g33716 [Phytophthora rubi]|uniref:Uncharacterized protein n=1 Tax=Phytophthora rubi TaxID=129364 RepID=A0A6A3GBU6_9STRA|nr:hypothetical protein PR001_g33716 [Phytophthora rubi]
MNRMHARLTFIDPGNAAAALLLPAPLLLLLVAGLVARKTKHSNQ